VLALAVPMFGNTPMKPDKRQVTIEMDVPNMPMKMKPITMTHTVTWSMKCTGKQEITLECRTPSHGIQKSLPYSLYNFDSPPTY
jgi:hypothetical protein